MTSRSQQLRRRLVLKNRYGSSEKIHVPGLGKESKAIAPKITNVIRGPKLIQFTSHSRAKMRQYGLSEARVKRVMHTPKRLEEGIVPKTIAMMQRAGNDKRPHEIWVMITEEKAKRKIISAWRYPGITKPGEPLPEEILKEMKLI